VPRKRYDKEFKRNAVELLMRGEHDLAPLAEDLGVCPSTLRYWQDRHLEAEAGSSKSPPREPTPLQAAAELRRLRKENEKLKRQREILKKALGILSDQSPDGMP